MHRLSLELLDKRNLRDFGDENIGFGMYTKPIKDRLFGKVAILGDADCDGITSAVIVKTALDVFAEDFGRYINCEIHIPPRAERWWSKKISHDADVLFVLDQTFTEEHLANSDKFAAMVSIDHHESADLGNLPENVYVINGRNFKTNLSAAGLCYLFAESLLGKDHPALLNLIQWATIGVIGDVCSLHSGDSRKLCIQGLRELKYGVLDERIKSACSHLGVVQRDISARDISYYIAPAINSIPRMNLGMDKLLSWMKGESNFLEIKNANDFRKRVYGDYKRTGAAAIERESELRRFSLYQRNSNVEIGGPVASFLANRFKRVVGVANSRGEVAYISFRCPGGISENVNVGEICKTVGEILGGFGGGHAAAAGMEIPSKNIQYVYSEVVKILPEYTVKERTADFVDLSVPEIIHWHSELHYLEPFGKDFHHPIVESELAVLESYPFYGHANLLLGDRLAKHTFKATYFNAGKEIGTGMRRMRIVLSPKITVSDCE